MYIANRFYDEAARKLCRWKTCKNLKGNQVKSMRCDNYWRWSYVVCVGLYEKPKIFYCHLCIELIAT